MSKPIRVVDLDQVSAFFAFTHFGGDEVRTAHTLGVEPAEIEALAIRHGWRQKLALVTAKGRSTSEVQRETNRAVNMVQAHRLRNLVDRVLTDLEGKEDLIAELTVTTKNGSYLDMKPLHQLVQAAAVAQEMTYRASGDTDRVKDPRDADASEGGAELGKAVLDALTVADSRPGLSSVALVRKQLEAPKDAPGRDG